jgi:outer membrane protein insertion porin family
VNLGPQVGGSYDEAAVSREVHRLWRLGRYSDVRAEMDGSGKLVFRVEPKRTVRVHKVRIEPNSFGLQPKVEEGATLDDAGAREVALQAQRELRSRGFPDAHVTYVFHGAGESADLTLHVDPGTPVRVKHLEFEGELGLKPQELSHQLRTLRTHRILFWKLLPDYAPDRVDYDVARLRSLYLSKGYYDVRIGARDAEINGKDADVRLWIESGPRYDGAPDPRALCNAFQAERRAAARQGILDFSAYMHVDLDAGTRTQVTTRTQLGSVYHVGRIEFTGNHRTPDSTLRRNLVLDEGNLMDDYLLRKSIARLDQTGLVESVDMRRIQLQTDAVHGIVNISIPVVERKRGMWSLSGPVGPAGIAGPLEASISARLPSWGRGLFELSTYSVSIGALGLYRPILATLGPPKNFLLPVLALRRPFLPGESWTSGIVFSPQLGWRATPLAYIATQFQERSLAALAGSRGLIPDIPVTVETPHGEGTMFCEAPKPRLSTLRLAGTILVRIPSALAMF